MRRSWAERSGLKALVPEGDNAASALYQSRGLETRQDGINYCLKTLDGLYGNLLVEKDGVEGKYTRDQIKCINPRKDDGTQTCQPARVYTTDGISPAVYAQDNGRMNILEETPTMAIGSMQKNAAIMEELSATVCGAAGMGGGQTVMVTVKQEPPAEPPKEKHGLRLLLSKLKKKSGRTE